MSDLRDRLERLRQAGRLQRRLGLKTAAELDPPAPRSTAPPTLRDLRDLPGMEEVAGPAGRFLLRTLRFDLDYTQGQLRLGELLRLPPGSTALAAPELAALDFEQAIFLDTETSGLAGGTGTIVFLTGVGRFEDGQYVVRQYFARDPAEEGAYLPHLHDLLHRARGVVSFNGKSFDLPLLRSRFILAGLPVPDLGFSHLDLLHPARRLWRARLGACNFGHLEQTVLGHHRGAEDVPSWLIPSLWQRFAAGANNVDDMARVLQHNLDDIVSMVPLACVVCRALSGVAAPHPADWLALGHIHLREDRLEEAEAAFRRALESNLVPEQQYEAMLGLAAVYKRSHRLVAAAFWWEQAIALAPARDPEPYVELAKYWEWEAHNPTVALRHTQAALALVEGWPRGYRRHQWLTELHHRRSRLLTKIGAGTETL